MSRFAGRVLLATGAVAAQLDGSIGLGVDVADEDAVAGAVATTAERLGRIDCVLNAAGHFHSRPLPDWTLENWNRMVAVHAGGSFLVCKHTLPLMRAQGGGAIVNVASIAAVVSQPENTAYGAAKGAIVAFSRQLAREAAPSIRVNVVLPGRVRTAMTRSALLRAGDGDALVVDGGETSV